MSYLEMALKASRKQSTGIVERESESERIAVVQLSCCSERPAEPTEPKQTPWPAASLEAEQRFGQPHARLFPFIGRKVRTPAGVGTLIQVFATGVTVVLDSETERCSFLQLAEIEPVSWELS